MANEDRRINSLEIFVAVVALAMFCKYHAATACPCPDVGSCVRVSGADIPVLLVHMFWFEPDPLTTERFAVASPRGKLVVLVVKSIIAVTLTLRASTGVGMLWGGTFLFVIMGLVFPLAHTRHHMENFVFQAVSHFVGTSRDTGRCNAPLT